eukprot:scaffold240397_cov13-Prasinocladus_malaysianus.AAC.1
MQSTHARMSTSAETYRSFIYRAATKHVRVRVPIRYEFNVPYSVVGIGHTSTKITYRPFPGIWRLPSPVPSVPVRAAMCRNSLKLEAGSPFSEISD